MFAARQRASQIARQLPRASRTYASESHAPHQVNESFGTGSLIGVGTFFAGAALYLVAPSEGESSSIQNLINKYTSRAEDWEETAQVHSQAVRQAGFDRNLFQYGGGDHRHVEVNYPEAIQSHSARNIRAGQLIKIDEVVEHYRQAHLKEEDRKAKKLAENKE